MSRVTRNGWKDSMTEEARERVLDKLCEQRWKDYENGCPEYTPAFPAEPSESIPEGLNPIASEFFEYYEMKRGFHSNARANFTTTSSLAFMNFSLLNYIETISTRPILFIIGEKAHSRYFTEEAYVRDAGPKELVVIPGARHIDLCDGTDMIPFDKLESFFIENLK